MATTTSGRAAAKTTAPRPVERRNRDEAVMAAAISVMSERGYSATSIQEVADRVGVLKGSLYHYFSSKEELLFRIISEAHAQNRVIAEEVAALGLPAVDELFEYLRRSCMSYLENVEVTNIYFAESRHLTDERRDQVRASGREFEKHIRDLVTRAQKDGQLTSPLDPRLLTRYVLGALNNVRTWPSRSGKSFSNSEMADAFVTMTRAAVGAPPV